MTYEYLCTACNHEWEADQKMSEAPLKKCPRCKKNRARRQVSGGQGFILKGGGWYADGYASSSGSDESSADSKSKDSKSTSKKSDDTTTKKTETESEPAAKKKEASA